MKNMKHCSFLLLTIMLFVTACSTKLSSENSTDRLTYKPLPRELQDGLRPAFDSVFYCVNAIPGCDLHSLIVIQNGKILYERYGMGHTATELHTMWSATKTFTATAVGFAMQDGLLSLDTPVVRYLQDELPDSLSPYMQRMTLDHLLKMSSGWKGDIITNRIKGGEHFDAVRACLTAPFSHEPGTHWRYNNMDTYLAGVVVQKLTGKTLEAYLRDKLFSRIGVDTLCYDQDWRGFNTGAWGMHISTETLAKLGLFMLQKGAWEGEQVLDSAWFDRAMAVHIVQYTDALDSDPRTEGNNLSDWKSGYCYQSWACHIPGSVRADGMWGQYAIVLPDKNAVIAMTTICSDREAQLRAIWEHVYPHL